MTLRVIRRTSCQVTDWAGGRTVQLDIYPPEAEYKKRNFMFRLSTAICTQEGESQFTLLPGIYRHLMILDGELHVRHEGHHEMTLHPFTEIDNFDGAWNTFSQGLVRDFNLMLGEGWSGGLSVIAQNAKAAISPREKCTAFFCGEGTADIALMNGEKVTLGRDDMAIMEDITAEGEVSVRLHDGAKVIRADVRGGK